MVIKKYTYEDLEEECKKYLSKKEIKEIKDAYIFARDAHSGQYRKSGEEYIYHPLHVAMILTSIYADSKTIIASLLHDVAEDTSLTLLDIEKKFGHEVKTLVDGVTKINNLNVNADTDYNVEYYKKIIVGMSEDVRVIIIKLADRLHNMRTLSVLSLEHQKKVAKETLEILSPIAHHLGIHKIKSELEDLSLRYLKPEVYFDIAEKLNKTKLERESIINEMMKDVSKILNDNGINHEIKGRAKSIYSIYKKLDKGRKFNEIFDLLAMRILVEKEQECYWALGMIHSKYKPVPKRFKDYIAMPKTNLYQTLHTTVIGLEGYCFEIQIRTYDMDEVAENGVASHWAYKENKNLTSTMQNITEQKLQFYKSIIELNKDKMSSEEFVTSVKEEVLNNNIYVFTPKGDVIELPKGSTPIDFAYRVHTEVGDHMTGAVINNVLVPLSQELHDQDIIKIITNKQSNGPTREWLNIAKTTQAKNKIKAFFNKNNKEEYIEFGKNLLEKELRRKKIAISSFISKENIELILKTLKLQDLEELYLNIGNNKYSPTFVINETLKKEEVIVPVEISSPTIKNKKDHDIIVGNVDNIKTIMAHCCRPVPGDEIIGYITKGNGISIHRINCQNVLEEEERLINASWNDSIKNKYSAGINVYSSSKENILLDFVQIASASSITIEKVNTIKEKEEITYSLIVRVNSLETLKKYISNLNKIKGVHTVERII